MSDLHKELEELAFGAPKTNNPFEIAFHNMRCDIMFNSPKADKKKKDSQGRTYYPYVFIEVPIFLYLNLVKGELRSVAIPNIDYSDKTSLELQKIENELGKDWKIQMENSLEGLKDFFRSKSIEVFEDVEDKVIWF